MVYITSIKPSKKWGEKKIDIPKDLEKILNMYIRKTGKKVVTFYLLHQRGMHYLEI